MNDIKIILLRKAYRLAYFSWKIIKWLFIRTTHGAQVVVWQNDSFLLVKASYRKQYSFPGGYINNGEKAEICASRELMEETGLNIASTKLSLFRQFVQCCGKVQCYDHIFEVTISKNKNESEHIHLAVDGVEIIDAKFVSVNEAVDMDLDSIAKYYLKKKKLLPVKLTNSI